MKISHFGQALLCIGTVALVLNTGCSNLPGTNKQQGAAIGGLSGAAAGAAIGGENHRALGALLGGVLGAGGGYVIGANSDRISNRDTSGAQNASQTAQAQPATAQQARNATTADLNNDGFVTLDEVVAMKNAGLSDQQMINRLQATGQIFELTTEQQNFLINQGVDRSVVTEMEQMNRAAVNGTLNPPNNNVISQPR